MSLKERIYSVLVVSSAEKLNTALSAFLPESRYQPVRYVKSISTARRVWSEHHFDYVIINSPLPDETGIRFAVDCSGAQDTVVLLLVQADLHDPVRDKVLDYGIFVLARPLSRSTFTFAMDWMASARERLRRFEKRSLSFEEKMEEIRIVDRAKWLLISELRMDEPQAHRYIEKQAMDRCLSKKEIAEEIIKTYS